ncbi:hypothetical protein [Sphingomonas oleivorans]|uniref:hypothetical protein n=1 Tax=Sphingomonas oleivorans TaxID=1735121 RepID=UPI0013FD7AF7|nr:hypothetical protein [Sphingomonas oleivorans]
MIDNGPGLFAIGPVAALAPLSALALSSLGIEHRGARPSLPDKEIIAWITDNWALRA